MSKNNGMIPKQKRHQHAPSKKWTALSFEERQSLLEEKKKTAFELVMKYPDCTEHNLKNAVQQTWGSYLSPNILKRVMKDAKKSMSTLPAATSPTLELDFKESNLSEPNILTDWGIIRPCLSTPIISPTQPPKHKTVLDSMVTAGFTPRQIADHALLMLTEPVK